MWAVLLLADGVDPISGGAGWVGAGLLGCVLAWLLLIHLPNKDKQMGAKDDKLQDILDKRDSAYERRLKELLDNFTETVKEDRLSWKDRNAEGAAVFKDALSQVVGHCERESLRTNETLKAGLNEMNQLLIGQREVLEEVRDALREINAQRRS